MTRRPYYVTITETRSKIVLVHMCSEDGALLMCSEQYKAKDIVLEHSDINDTRFEVSDAEHE